MEHEIKYAFRMVHIENIPHVLEYGFVHKDSCNADPNYIPIGDTSVIRVREERAVVGEKTIGQYIPFYFGPRSPMLYVVQHGYNGVRQYDAENLVYCVLRIDDIIEKGINCIFTDGHAVNFITTTYDGSRLNELNSIISYDDVYASCWNDENDRDLKRRKEAELLIEDELPADFIRGFVVYNEVAYNKLISYGVAKEKIVIRKEYYF